MSDMDLYAGPANINDRPISASAIKEAVGSVVAGVAHGRQASCTCERACSCRNKQWVVLESVDEPVGGAASGADSGAGDDVNKIGRSLTRAG